ncbi:MAG: PQQ-binding-like beta-propeller repeat protein [Sandaracinaceae bacterium]|nr:PQQ-binding-like beta-propeller repeat protein [Sandaracinaceae bacterium]
MSRLRDAAAAWLLAMVLVGCGSTSWIGGGDYGFLTGTRERPGPGTRAVRVRWRVEVAPGFRAALAGTYVPVERAAAELDPAHDRVYLGSSAGQLWALTGAGARVYAYESGPIAARPTLDAMRDELYVPTEDGVLHLLQASSGSLRWRCEVGGAVTQPAVLVGDAAYVVTDTDVVVAVDRSSGETLWRYRRDAPEGFYIAEHAGLALSADQRRLITGFTDGVVVSLSPSDGSVQWERDTTIDLEPGADGTARFADVDATPVIVGDVVYAASFAGGLHALELASGTVLWRDAEISGVTSLAPGPDGVLVIASADMGLAAIVPHESEREVLWRKRPPRGAVGHPTLVGDLVLYGETQGGFITASMATGEEIGRIEVGTGFTAPATVADGRGFILSNGGVLLAFALPGAR